VVHVVNRFAVGGLENGLVNLINWMPPERYRHAIISLTDYTDFRERIRRTAVPIIALHKREGETFGVHVRLWRVLRQLRPHIVHTRNLPGLEFLLSALLAGVPGRVHGEHGRDVYDLDGLNRKYNLLRKAVRPFVQRYITVSADLEHWLVQTVGVARTQVVQIYNGVDIDRFFPRQGPRNQIGPDGFFTSKAMFVGTVGRLHVVKDQITLVRAFLHLLQHEPSARDRVRLVLVGDGPLREDAQRLLVASGAASLAWLPGERTDIPEILQNLDLFVLPSLREGISNTILEAMASGLPVIATRVGGNPELVEEGQTGMLIPSADPPAMATAIQGYLTDKGLLTQQGKAARERVEKHFSMNAMVNGYLAVYDAIVGSKRYRGSPELEEERQ
jgi:sugar transferase (PEP-CTERM/EpsH1 system associated)